MKLPDLPFTVIDWRTLEGTEHPGDPGTALWRTFKLGDVRVRIVEYSPGYVADHWCDKGHVIYLVEGDLQCELRDGRKFSLEQGMGYIVSDFGDPSHRSSTQTGAKLFIVD